MRTGGKFRPVSNFMELHALTLATRSYALLSQLILNNLTCTVTSIEFTPRNVHKILYPSCLIFQTTLVRSNGVSTLPIPPSTLHQHTSSLRYPSQVFILSSWSKTGSDIFSGFSAGSCILAHKLKRVTNLKSFHHQCSTV